MIEKVRHGLLAATCTLAVISPVLVAATHRVRNVVHQDFTSPDVTHGDSVPIEFSYLDYPGTTTSHAAEIIFSVSNLSAFVSNNRLSLLVATFSTSPRLEGATLRIGETQCVFSTPQGAVFPNNAELTFERGNGCLGLRVAPAGLVTLDISFRGPGRLGVWTLPPYADRPVPASVYAANPLAVEPEWSYAVQGRFTNDVGVSPFDRLDLLTYVWQISAHSTWLLFAIVGGALLITAGLLIAPPLRSCTSFAAGTAALSLTLGLAILYAVLVPPFQAPDEPSHLLGYGFVVEDPSISLAARDWADVMNFERIRFRSNEKFTPSDIGKPERAAWNAVFVQDFARSSITVPLWRLVAQWLRPFSVPEKLLALRLINALLFAASVAAATALVVRLFGAPAAALSVFLIAPTVFFFATYVSNYGPATSAYMLMGCGVLLLVNDVPYSGIVGAILGCALALALAATRSAAPMIWFTAVLTAGRMCLGTKGESDARTWLRNTLQFWLGLGAGGILFGSLLTQWQSFALRSQISRNFPAIANSLSPLRVTAAVALGTALIWIVEILFYAIRARLRKRPAATVRRYANYFALAICMWLSSTLVLSIFVRLPHLVSVAARPSRLEYVATAMASMSMPFRLRFPDPLLSETFWASFGWTETVPSEILIDLLSAVTGLMALVNAWRILRHQETRNLIWMLFFIGAYLTTVGVYAALAFDMAPDLHGRYLEGLYISLILVAWSAAFDSRPADHAQSIVARLPAATALVTASVAHAWSLSGILQRYF